MLSALLRVVLGVSLVVVATRSASAQTCLARPGISATSPVQVGGGVGFQDIEVSGVTLGQVTTFYGTVSGGGDRSFVEAEVRSVSLEDTTRTAWGTRIWAGGQIANDSSRRVVVCPFASFSTSNGPNDTDNGIAQSTIGFGGGATVGVVALDSGSVQIAPAFGVGIERVRSKLQVFEDELVVNDNGGLVLVGVGIIVQTRFGITPAWVIPFGFDTEGVQLRVTFTVAFPK
jgi:hypothetical protein